MYWKVGNMPLVKCTSSIKCNPLIANFACESSNGNDGSCKCSKPYSWDGKGCNDCDASLKYEKTSQGICGIFGDLFFRLI
jgi:hypothetical protein